MLVLPERQQQIELLGEQLVVIVEVEPEQREGFDERSPTGHDLGATLGDQVECRELLEHPHRIIRAEHRDRAREPDPRGPCRRGGEHDRRCRHGEIGAVMLTDAEHVEPDLVGQLDLLEQIAQTPVPVDARADLGETVDTQVHVAQPSDACLASCGPPMLRNFCDRIIGF
jgi:hypothetical protein